MLDIITCIYCKKDHPRPSRGEHIVLECLGGTTCIPDVCQGCNNDVLGPLDQDFARNSPVVLHRLFNPGRPGQVQEPQFFEHPPMGGFLDIDIRTGQTGIRIPHQLFLLDGKLTSLAPLGTEEQNRAALEYYFTVQGNSRRVHRAIRDIPEHAPARLVVYPKNSRWRFVVRARTEDEANALLASLANWQRLWDGAARHFESTVNVERVSVRLSTPANAIERCVAKMAFNFLAHHLGAEFALRSEFDAVRSYINGENVEPVLEVPAPDGGEAGWTVDTRFVTPWHTNRAMDASPWTLPGGHTLALTAHARDIFCGVHLFDGHEHFKVFLGHVNDDATTSSPLPFFLFASDDPGTADEFFDSFQMLERKGIFRRTKRPRGPTSIA